ncbi:hypothetical protein B4U45_25935 [Mycobacterium persicum]|uniref:Uncharacterized protein n=1 Tax=Mycobacterium persicum TaxID=1487726 RepID=A0A1X0LF10_9MYCO|nr:hypothetical protein A4G31_24470 [Mycobacterium persicum]ORB38452.1 hypothetical protein BST40_23045 [Mycobacterium persicum]ORB92087.1 hypothetical protein B1T49_25755 [Mycobacterium persicum]ORB97456.1 hypothetical protein B1T44_26420 [Mycobacterium persicum]ORC04096.1 hypothetical protein B1T48_25550 [Mycobacterium persicum]
MSAAGQRSTCFGYGGDAGGVADFAVACLVTSATVASGAKGCALCQLTATARGLPELSLWAVMGLTVSSVS